MSTRCMASSAAFHKPAARMWTIRSLATARVCGSRRMARASVATTCSAASATSRRGETGWAGLLPTGACPLPSAGAAPAHTAAPGAIPSDAIPAGWLPITGMTPSGATASSGAVPLCPLAGGCSVSE